MKNKIDILNIDYNHVEHSNYYKITLSLESVSPITSNWFIEYLKVKLKGCSPILESNMEQTKYYSWKGWVSIRINNYSEVNFNKLIILESINEFNNMDIKTLRKALNGK